MAANTLSASKAIHRTSCFSWGSDQADNRYQMNSMSTNPPSKGDDPFDLSRFVSAQEDSYACALSEVKNGQKRSHWMWFIYPQLRGLGHSSTAQLYGITGVDEARSYLAHPLLGPRLIEVCEAVLSTKNRSATQIFGEPDDMKLCSCATLFAHVSNADSVFHRILDKFFDGKSDLRTMELLGFI